MPSRERASTRRAIRLAPKKRRYPSAEGVLRAIRDRKGRDLKLNFDAVFRDDYSLYKAAVTRFGSYPNALVAAGFDPATIRLTRARGPEDSPTFARLVRTAGAGGAGAAEARTRLIREYRIFMLSRCGRWKDVARSFGVPPNLLISRGGHNRRTVLAGLKERIERGASVKASDVQREDFLLMKGVRRHFGSIYDCYRLLGYRPPPDPRHYPEAADRDLLLAALRAAIFRPRARKGLRRPPGSVWARLASLAPWHFGSLSQALRSAGLPPSSLPARVRAELRSTGPDTMKEELARCARDAAYRRGFSAHERSTLFRLTARSFGSVFEALREAGFSKKEALSAPLRASRRYPGAQAVIADLRSFAARGVRLARINLHRVSPHADGELLEAARDLFGRWSGALEAAGVEHPAGDAAAR